MKTLKQHKLDKVAITILRENDRGGYTVPTDALYPYQWNWDSAFAALGFAEFDLPRAWKEIETLFTGSGTMECCHTSYFIGLMIVISRVLVSGEE